MTYEQTFRNFISKFEPMLRKISLMIQQGIKKLASVRGIPLDLLVSLLIGSTRFWPPMDKSKRWALQVLKGTIVRFGDISEIDPQVVANATLEEEKKAMLALNTLAMWTQRSLSRAYDQAFWRALITFKDPIQAEKELSEIFFGGKKISHPLLSLARDIWFEFVP